MRVTIPSQGDILRASLQSGPTRALEVPYHQRMGGQGGGGDWFADLAQVLGTAAQIYQNPIVQGIKGLIQGELEESARRQAAAQSQQQMGQAVQQVMPLGATLGGPGAVATPGLQQLVGVPAAMAEAATRAAAPPSSPLQQLVGGPATTAMAATQAASQAVQPTGPSGMSPGGTHWMGQRVPGTTGYGAGQGAPAATPQPGAGAGAVPAPGPLPTFLEGFGPGPYEGAPPLTTGAGAAADRVLTEELRQQQILEENLRQEQLDPQVREQLAWSAFLDEATRRGLPHNLQEALVQRMRERGIGPAHALQIMRNAETGGRLGEAAGLAQDAAHSKLRSMTPGQLKVMALQAGYSRAPLSEFTDYFGIGDAKQQDELLGMYVAGMKLAPAPETELDREKTEGQHLSNIKAKRELSWLNEKKDAEIDRMRAAAELSRAKLGLYRKWKGGGGGGTQYTTGIPERDSPLWTNPLGLFPKDYTTTDEQFEFMIRSGKADEIIAEYGLSGYDDPKLRHWKPALAYSGPEARRAGIVLAPVAKEGTATKNKDVETDAQKRARLEKERKEKERREAYDRQTALADKLAKQAGDAAEQAKKEKKEASEKALEAEKEVFSSRVSALKMKTESPQEEEARDAALAVSFDKAAQVIKTKDAAGQKAFLDRLRRQKWTEDDLRELAAIGKKALRERTEGALQKGKK